LRIDCSAVPKFVSMGLLSGMGSGEMSRRSTVTIRQHRVDDQDTLRAIAGRPRKNTLSIAVFTNHDRILFAVFRVNRFFIATDYPLRYRNGDTLPLF
jgi:hypothetical protein